MVLALANVPPCLMADGTMSVLYTRDHMSGKDKDTETDTETDSALCSRAALTMM